VRVDLALRRSVVISSPAAVQLAAAVSHIHIGISSCAGTRAALILPPSARTGPVSSRRQRTRPHVSGMPPRGMRSKCYAGTKAGFILPPTAQTAHASELTLSPCPGLTAQRGHARGFHAKNGREPPRQPTEGLTKRMVWMGGVAKFALDNESPIQGEEPGAPAYAGWGISS
jgi:hypothetical protein